LTGPGVTPDSKIEAARQTETARSRWLDPGWHEEVHAWIEYRLAERGITVIGPVTQPHIRPWSTALSVATDAGPVWFKAAGPGNTHEAALVEAMARWRIPGILEPLAVETERGWLLLPDGGTRLCDVTHGGPDLEHWQRILPEWASTQRRLASHSHELIAVGVPDLRPPELPARFAALCDDPEVLLSADDRARLRALLPTYAGWCTELDSFGIAASLQHDDLHDGNVFVGEGGDRIFDWGDASVAHPFGTLLVTLRSIVSRGLGDDGDATRALDRLRDAYLEPWTAEHPMAELRRAVPLAMRVAIVGRSLSWKRALSGIPTGDRGEWGDAVGGWLMDLFEPSLV